MALVKKRLGDLLVESGIISEDQLKEALVEQRNTKQKLGDLLITQGYITEQQLIEVLEFQLGIPHVSLYKFQIDPAITQIIPESMARRYQAIPLQKDGGKLMVAMADPLDYFAIEEMRMTTGFRIEPAISSKDELQRAIARHYGLQDSMSQMMGEITTADEIKETEITSEDSPIVRLVNKMIQQAVQLRVSDIHVDPGESNVVIRYRVDGFLRTERVIPKQMQGFLTARLKIMAKLNIAERRLPQDGRIKVNVDFKTVDIRVSTLPTIHGEKIVLRLLDLTSGVKPIDNLGFSARNIKAFKEMIAQPFGILLITGPTGSGKTTTLYSALSHLNKEDTNIITVEDPVEYQLEGINQVHVNAQIGLTFAAGLRSILRQDPNIVMVGEIRDTETAEIAVRASLTGHLVLSTLHTNDSISTVTRFRDMGIEPYLIASSLVGVVAQRLVRRICPECRKAHAPTEQELFFMKSRGMEEVGTLYKGTGCGACNQTGYQGRAAIHEVLVVSEELRQLISENATVQEMRAEAVKMGLVQLMDDGIAKVINGTTTLQEVIRETVAH
ncbi:GspE/PulE family protein [Paenibacillus mucilaginosus]|uniref:Type II secretion system protein E n=3 Tax=Paenibacillus mucilaginosus TaxID=61624 RepID=H6NPN6_9BACL|nr:ATPase, T2SS/T4P/T4SS family [Paenibacillus mucilaginosus]AEI45725.1 type II secretion system protein E [Paenibacillus mucilaginosus KNP414]AFC33392.1 type II secretion system protein E [Paenibacillus mucilaginosus 3016]AFH65702.2 type II secretion system protein E [Paenibacillus mucilaginosus K02]MCG7215088.1 Flp pilus assembly complex ATPase component TadA [Paenibacillus mucilaginosus]WDM27112.1 Flp pilus assembly complex ATPase component TadA [Paenibacillus mucilaginosus]